MMATEFWTTSWNISKRVWHSLAKEQLFAMLLKKFKIN
jgi:hypothetical protein